jgi:hypothetical protein
MMAEVGRSLWLALLVAVAIYFVKVIATILLRHRASSGLVPDIRDDDQPSYFGRLVSLIGVRAAPTRTLGMTRMPASLGLRLWVWGVTLVLVCVALGMQPGMSGLDSLLTWSLVLVAAHQALRLVLYEVSYDTTRVWLPGALWGRTEHRWRDLVAITEPDSWRIKLTFADGRSASIFRHLAGYEAFRDVAGKALRS